MARLALVAFMPSLLATASSLFAFFFAYYIYEPPTAASTPTAAREAFGRAQGVQHVLRGAALGGALVGGGFLLSVWEPFPFVLAAGVTSLACGAVVVLVREPPVGDPVRALPRLPRGALAIVSGSGTCAAS